MEKKCKWLSKKAWNMLTINPLQADKIINMTIYNVIIIIIIIYIIIIIIIIILLLYGFTSRF